VELDDYLTDWYLVSSLNSNRIIQWAFNPESFVALFASPVNSLKRISQRNKGN
jgi:hypothetical protein